MEKKQTSCPKAVCEKIFKAITFSPAFSTIRRISMTSRQQTTSSSSSSSPAKHAPPLPLPNSTTSDPPIVVRTLDIKTKRISPYRPKPSSSSPHVSSHQVPIKFDYTTARPPTTSARTPPPTDLNPKPSQSQLPLAPKPKPPAGNGNGDQQSKSKPKPKAANNHGKLVQVQVGQQQHDQGKYDDTFSAYINQTKKRINMSHDDEDDHITYSPKVAKDHHFSDYIDRTKRRITTTPSIKPKSFSIFKS